MAYNFNPKKHLNPIFKYDLDKFYYVLDKDSGFLLIFEKKKNIKGDVFD